MINDSSTTRLVQFLTEQLRSLRPGDRLPSSRSLVERHAVSPVTVSRALAVLAAEGLVTTRPGSGTFVAQPPGPPQSVDHAWQTVALGGRTIDTEGLSTMADPPHDDAVISLATGYLHTSLMPLAALGAAMARAARLPDAWERPPASGLHSLRAWFGHQTGAGVDAKDVLITPGGQSAISAAFRAMLPAGAPILVESPTYPGALSAARAAGLRPVPVPMDAHGVNPDLLAEAFGRTGAQAFFCQPAYQNPTGAVLSAARRPAVLAAAAAANAFVIEDDYARWLCHSARAPRPLISEDTDGRVVYLTSLTKVASPSLRIGALIARGPVAARLRAMRLVDDMFVSRPAQEATLELVSRAGWDRHLHALRDALAQRSDALAAALAAHLPEASLGPRPGGGLHLWVRLRDHLDDVELATAARRAGVVVMAGRPFFPAEAAGSYLRVTFSAARSVGELGDGVRRLARAAAALQDR